MTSVSVVINAFNYDRYLARAIDSALAQRSPNVDLEVVVVDDGSTDGTPRVAEEYRGRILYRRTANCGQASAIQEGLRLASGEIICLLDADDEFYGTKIRSVVDTFRATSAFGAVYNSYLTIDSVGRPFGTPFVWERARQRVRQYALFWSAGGVPTSSINLRQDVARKLRIPNEFRICADTYILAALPHVTEIGWIESPLTGYRIHGKNAFSSLDSTARDRLLQQNWRSICGALRTQYNIELSIGLFETQERRACGRIGSAVLSCMAGLGYVIRADACMSLKVKESIKLAAAFAGFYRPLA